MVEQSERALGLRAQPVGEQRLDLRGGGGVCGQRVVAAGESGDQVRMGRSAGEAGGRGGDEEAGGAEAERLRVEAGGGDAAGFGDGEVGVVAESEELLAVAAEVGGVG